MIRTLLRAAAVPALALGLLAVPASGQEITMASSSAVTSMDPHFHNLSSNIAMDMHVFSRLIEQDEHQRLRPALATEWAAINDTTWEFKLRRGVKFHDGSDFGAEDVAASLRRVPWVPNSPGSFAIYTQAIAETIVVDDHTIRFRTAAPYPLLPVDLSLVDIVSRRHEHAPTVDFNSGRAMIGTGPFKFVSYAPGDRVVLERFDGYWGPKPAWQKATLRIIPNSAARIAALLAGDVQAIDSVPPTDLPRLQANPAIAISRVASNSAIFLHMDQARDQTPFATDKSGVALPRNPFRDLRVRQALSKAINRQALVERVMEGAAAPAGFMLAAGFFGVSPKLKPDAYDPEGARRLLAEAGYPDGFALTIHGPNDRYLNDDRVLQAIAPMLTRVGLDIKVVTLPWASYITQAGPPTYAFSTFLVGNSATTGEASFPLRVQFATVNAARGMGASNRARYSNPTVDAVLDDALKTIEDTKREALLQQAGEIAMADQAVVPLYFPEYVFALRKGLNYTARADGYMAAFMVSPAN